MCRFLLYKGPDILLSELITKPHHSLIKQSYCARERPEPLNGDGFGIGWYAPRVSPEPCLFTSITPAWANQNLKRLVDKIRSPCIVAHLRAASKGLVVTELNCHPFQYGPLLWMHNGEISEFAKIKRRIRESLKDEYYNIIQGTTDSEHAFALFLNFLQCKPEEASADDFVEAIRETIHFLEKCSKEAGIREVSYYNFAVTNGFDIVVTRYSSNPEVKPETLYYTICHDVETHDGICEISRSHGIHPAVIIASEPITLERKGWLRIPRNQMLVVSETMRVKTSRL